MNPDTIILVALTLLGIVQTGILIKLAIDIGGFQVRLEWHNVRISTLEGEPHVRQVSA